MPTVVASRVVVLPVANEPWAKIVEPTLTSPRLADAPAFEYVVAFETSMVKFVPRGSLTVMEFALVAVTFPITLGCSTSILFATVDPGALGMMRT